MSALCEATSADVSQVAHALGTDSRIGPKFLNASVGFGGSCFQKDILNLAYICECHGLKEVADYWYSVVGMNDYQKSRFVKRVVSAMFNTIRNKKIAMLGFAFKKDTGDTRETPAIDVGRGLIEDGARLAIYDPKVSEEQIAMDMEGLTDNITCYKSAMEALDGAHAVTVMTEWDEFKAYDWKKIYGVMQKPAFVFDGRNILDHEGLKEIGFIVYALGKPIDPFLKSAEGA
jgi:UDPglucose 6-dehydrogenase